MQRKRQKGCLPSPKLSQLFEDRVTKVRSWVMGRFRRFHTSGRMEGYFEVKFDDGELHDICLDPDDYGDSEHGWFLVDMAE